MTGTTLRLRARAKINWSLEVTGRRDDGYHELVTVLQTVAFDDLLELTVGTQASFAAGGPEARGVPGGDANLVTRARERFAASVPSQAGAGQQIAVSLEKRIPPAAGLGGGSSDAAAVLRGLNLLAGRTLDTAHLESLAADIGSDTAFFIRGGTQLATGRGEQLTPLPDVSTCWLVLVSPRITLEAKTSRLYKFLRPGHFSDGTRTRALTDDLRLGRVPDASRFVNTFDHVAAAAFPGIDTVREALRRRCGAAVLCGSGPSVFAPMHDRAAAEQAANDLRAGGLPAHALHTVTAAESTAFRWIHHSGRVDILE